MRRQLRQALETQREVRRAPAAASKNNSRLVGGVRRTVANRKKLAVSSKALATYYATSLVASAIKMCAALSLEIQFNIQLDRLNFPNTCY